MCVVYMSTAMSRTPVPQTHGNSKADPPTRLREQKKSFSVPSASVSKQFAQGVQKPSPTTFTTRMTAA